MKKILICCGGGFSSSVLCKSINQGLQKYKLEDKYTIDFLPIITGVKKMDEYDILICCPHLLYHMKDILADASPDVPIYILPPKMYGAVDVKELTMDVEDIIEIFKETKTNPVHFPGEENPMIIPRRISYRNYSKLQNK